MCVRKKEAKYRDDPRGYPAASSAFRKWTWYALLVLAVVAVVLCGRPDLRHALIDYLYSQGLSAPEPWF